MSTQRIWKVVLPKEECVKSIKDGEEQIFLIGQESGLRVRKKEIYFAQREKDSDNYVFRFDPEPDYLSYSFFYGMFYPTIQKMYQEYIDKENVSLIAVKKIVSKKFQQKYAFSFKKNEQAHKDNIDSFILAILDGMNNTL